MTQLVQFVVTLIHRPDLIILDELFAGLDPLNVQLMKEMLAIEQARGATVIFSTHVLSDVEEMSERVALIADGRVILSAYSSAGIVLSRFEQELPSLNDIFIEEVSNARSHV